MKKKLWKTRIAAALAVVCALSFLAGPMQVYAIEFNKDAAGNLVARDDAGFYYMVPAEQPSSKECVLYTYDGTKMSITLPKKAGSYKVTTVGMDFTYALSSFGSMLGNGDTSLTKVVIPSGYTTIESSDSGETGAFQKQDKLGFVSIPASVKKIGQYAFTGCDMEKLTFVTTKNSYAHKYAKKNGINYLIVNAKTATVGSKKTLATYSGNAKMTWKSSNKSVATVSYKGGKLTVNPKKAGTAKITATMDGQKYTFTLTVKKKK